VSGSAAIGICGGGTGGHIFPALAVIQALREQAVTLPVYYFGKEDGMERELIGRYKISFYGLSLSGFSRSFSFRNLVSLWKAGAGFQKARHYLKKLHVKAILGTGGYVCGPVILAAASLGIPSIIHESNYIPGLTNRLLANWVTTVGVSHAPTGKYFPARKVVVTGFPLRERLGEPTREAGCRVFGLDPGKRVLFIFPGSQAARKINRTVADMLPLLTRRIPDLQLIWMTGEADFALAQRASKQTDIRVSLHPFIHEVPEAYAAADVVLARAGAGTIAELSATGKPALLIPYPFATANHQVHNAAVLQKYGSAEVMEDKEVEIQTLLVRLAKIFKRLKQMNECGAILRADYPKQAAQELACRLIRLAEKKSI